MQSGESITTSVDKPVKKVGEAQRDVGARRAGCLPSVGTADRFKDSGRDFWMGKVTLLVPQGLQRRFPVAGHYCCSCLDLACLRQE